MTMLLALGMLAQADEPVAGTAPEDLAILAELPNKAQALRDQGMDADQVEAVLDVVRASKLSGRDVVDLLGTTSRLVQQHGPVDDFPDFLGERIEAGRRGDELAADVQKAHEKGAVNAVAPGPSPTTVPKASGGKRPKASGAKAAGPAAAPSPSPSNGPKASGSKRAQ